MMKPLIVGAVVFALMRWLLNVSTMWSLILGAAVAAWIWWTAKPAESAATTDGG